jgi:hypothetical protein
VYFVLETKQPGWHQTVSQQKQPLNESHGLWCLILYARSPNSKHLLFVATGVQGQHASSTKLTHPEDDEAHVAKMLASNSDPTECQNPEDNELLNNPCASLETYTIMNQHLTFVVAILLTNDIC